MHYSHSPSLNPQYTVAHNGLTGQNDIIQQAFLDNELAQQLNDPSFTGYADPQAFNAGLVDSHLSPHSLSNHTSPAAQDNSFPTFDYNTDSALINDLGLVPPQGNNVGLGNNLGTMSAISHAPTPAHLLARNSNSPSPSASPAAQHSPFAPMGRPRGPSESLGPADALNPRSSGDWTMHRQHRRVPSDNISDISSHSNQASPFMPTLESFETMSSHASPLLNAQDPMLGDALNMGQFSLNDPHAQQAFFAPAHSPHISPRLMPQQALPLYTAEDNFGMNMSNGTFDPFATQSEAFPSMNTNDMGQADHMSPPDIVIERAPTQLTMDGLMPSQQMDDSLALPPRTHRHRSKSESYSRPTTPALSGRGRAPSLQQTLADSLSPFDPSASNPSSRSSSRGRATSLTNRGRSTSATSDQREYILDLANPERSPSTGDSRRAQKHPATFQCTLCPKRFTRAYNLRSHLRTHTDERPFICTVCSKAFARQHDRKRHEGLHTGEKKFACRGPLKNGEQWGCNRRFARADALGRHFRSEAGRVCIKALLEEEATEKQQANSVAWMEQQQNNTAFQQGSMDFNSNFLPARLLEQYPQLAGIDWANVAAQGNDPDDGYLGRSSFDASSGGEMYDDLSEGEIVDPSIGMGLDMGQHQHQHLQSGFVQQQHHQQPMMTGYSNQMSDYARGFEGS